MTTYQCRTTRTLAQLLKQLAGIPDALEGNQRDADELRRVFLAHFMHSLFTSIHAAFLIKADGGTDELGKRWKPLKPSTILAKIRKRRRGEYRDEDEMDRTRKAEWTKSRNRFYAHFKQHMPADKALFRANRAAWDTVKQKGVLPKVFINIDTHALEKSLRPGTLVQGVYTPRDPKQIADDTIGDTTIGTSVEYAAHVHKARPLWPSERDIRPWLVRATEAAVDGVANHLRRRL